MRNLLFGLSLILLLLPALSEGGKFGRRTNNAPAHSSSSQNVPNRPEASPVPDSDKAPGTENGGKDGAATEGKPDPADYIAEMAMKRRAEIGHRVLIRDPRLDAAARVRARQLVTNFSHFYGGFGPPKYIRDQGFPLPPSMSNHSNSVESIASYPSAEEAWQGWMESANHKKHILGYSGFTSGHTHFGVGEYNGKWVFISVPIAKEEK